MIRSFRHAGLEKFFRTGSKAGIQPAHAKRLQILLTALNQVVQPADLTRSGWGLHPLQGSLQNHYSLSVNGNWRLTFSFEQTDVILLDYLDYH